MTRTEPSRASPGSGAMAWDGGWYRYARAVASPNFGERPQGAVVDLLVLHSISLPPGEYGGDGVRQLFTNSLDWGAHPYYAGIQGLTVSAHFFIQRNGALWQFVDCDARAWHAGDSCYRGRANCNDDSIGIELEGLEGDPFESSQYEATAALCIAIAQRYPIAHVAGHEHIAPGRKTDPGSGFDWARMQAMVGWADRYFPELL